MLPSDQFKTPCQITWCKGCGDFGILTALKNAFLKLGWGADDVLLVYGIGCHGHMINYLKTYGFGGLHGRALPLASGAKVANHKLNVICIVGDGDQLGEGGNHLIHAARRNTDITCLIHNNQNYALTVGQTSPTSEKGYKSKSTPQGASEEPLSPIALAVSSGATFVARSFAGDVNHLTEIIIKGLKHKGFSLIDVLQPCVTLNYLNTYSWFYKRVYKLKNSNTQAKRRVEDEGKLRRRQTSSTYNLKSKLAAFKKSLEWGDKIPIGIFYQEDRPTFEKELPQIREKPLVEQPLDEINIDKLLKEFS